MSEFVDLMEALPVGVVAIAILLAVACAGLVVLAFCSIPDQDVSDLEGWDLYTAERATRSPRALPPERVDRRKRAAHNIARHYHNGNR